MHLTNNSAINKQVIKILYNWAGIAQSVDTQQEHQTIPTNATVSKVSDIENEWRAMRKIDF